MNQKTASRRTARLAFTLIELMIVAVVLAILAAAIVPNVVGRAEKARRSRAKSDIAMLESLLDNFYLDVGRYPTTEEGLRVLYYAPEEGAEQWGGPYMKKPQFTDPWGNEYVYRSPATNTEMPYEIISYGADGEEGGEDDNADVTSYIETEESL